ncbi:MAG TPA: hypothetical protein PKZ76_06365 [Xanthomonadaceae bacterium]|nr:hypothetical protein [Xanthomonadaceae bacterium]
MTTTQSTRPAMRLTAAALTLAFAGPALADADLDALKAELAQQRQMLEKQQQVIEKLEQKLAKQGPAASVAAGPTAKGEDKPLVTIYGVLDGGVEHLTNVGAEKKSLTRVPPITATLPSRIGFRLHKEVRPGLAHSITHISATPALVINFVNSPS